MSVWDFLVYVVRECSLKDLIGGMAPQKAKMCFVSNCKSGYRSCKLRASLFCAAKDANCLET